MKKDPWKNARSPADKKYDPKKDNPSSPARRKYDPSTNRTNPARHKRS